MNWLISSILDQICMYSCSTKGRANLSHPPTFHLSPPFSPSSSFYLILFFLPFFLSFPYFLFPMLQTWLSMNSPNGHQFPQSSAHTYYAIRTSIDRYIHICIGMSQNLYTPDSVSLANNFKS